MRTRVGWGDPRPYYNNQSATQVSLFYHDEAVAPHAITSRGVRTVSTLRHALITALSFGVVRNVAAGTAGPIRVRLRVGGVNVYLLYFGRNVTNDSSSLTVEPYILVPGGSVVEMFTEDASTGGSLTYAMSVSLTEFSIT